MRGLWRRPKPAAVLRRQPLIDVAVGSEADIAGRFWPCPLCPQERTNSEAVSLSAMCH